MKKNILKFLILSCLGYCMALPANIGGAGTEENVEEIVSPIALQWLDKTSMKITWANQKTDLIYLAISEDFTNLREEDCLFQGIPEGNANLDFVASVFGCFNDGDDTLVSLGIENELLELVLLTNGTTMQMKFLDNPDHNKNIKHSRNKRSIYHGVDFIDYNRPPPAAFGSGAGPLPSKLEIKLDLGYDNGLLQLMGSHEKTKKHITQIYLRMLSYFKIPGMPTNVRWLAWPSFVIPFTDITMSAEEMCCKYSKEGCYDETQNEKILNMFGGLRKKNKIPLMVFTRQASGVSGCSNHHCACGIEDGTNFGITNANDSTSRRSVQSTARIFAHELGHMLGMLHDFSPEHGGEGGECMKLKNDRGIMSIDKDVHNRWSKCSSKDMKKWWSQYGALCPKKIGLPRKDSDSIWTKLDD